MKPFAVMIACLFVCTALMPVFEVNCEDFDCTVEAIRIHSDIMNRFFDSGTRQVKTRLKGGDVLEDCTLYGGFYLACLCDAYAASGEKSLASDARNMYEGLKLNLEIAGIPGFLARGRNADDSYRGDPSVDQYTALIYSFWRFYYSGLATEDDKAYIRRSMNDILSRFEAAQWRITKENGELVTWWRLNAEEVTRADRFLAFLLAAHDITGNDHWLDVYNEKLPQLLEHCSGYEGLESWVLIQSQVCLVMLSKLEKRPDIRDVYVKGMAECGRISEEQLTWYRYMPEPDSPERMLSNFYDTPPIFTWTVRDPIEAAAVMLMSEVPSFRKAATQALKSFSKRYRLDLISMNVAVVPWEWGLWLAAAKGR